MIRRIATTIAASLTALALLAVPALAGSSFTSGAEAPADSDHPLELTITEPEDEDYGNTARVTVVAPASFTVLGCQQELTWDCTADDGSVTFTRTALGALGDNTLQFSVRTPKTNGTYRFQVTQADEAEEPNTVRSAPTVTVTGGTDPAPKQDDSGGSTDDGGSTGGDTSSGDTGSTADSGGTDDTASEDDGTTGDGDTSSDDTAGTSGDDSTADSGGSTAPRRTEGRSNGTRLQITPGQSTTDDPSVNAPDVADDPAVAPPSDGDEQDDAETGTATMTAIAGQADDEQDDAGGMPWQQLLGAALLVAGGAALAVRRWDVPQRIREWDVLGRVREWDPLGRIRRWRS